MLASIDEKFILQDTHMVSMQFHTKCLWTDKSVRSLTTEKSDKWLANVTSKGPNQNHGLSDKIRW